MKYYEKSLKVVNTVIDVIQYNILASNKFYENQY